MCAFFFFFSLRPAHRSTEQPTPSSLPSLSDAASVCYMLLLFFPAAAAGTAGAAGTAWRWTDLSIYHTAAVISARITMSSCLGCAAASIQTQRICGRTPTSRGKFVLECCGRRLLRMGAHALDTLMSGLIAFSLSERSQSVRLVVQALLNFAPCPHHICRECSECCVV